MASKREGRHTIRINMAEAGVNTAQARALSPENSLWECENMGVDFRGALRKRPKINNIGHPIVEPTDYDSGSGEMLSRVFPVNGEDWVLASRIKEETYVTPMQNGTMGVSILPPATTAGEYVLRRNILYGDGESFSVDSAYSGDFTFGFSVKTRNLSDSVISFAAPAGVHLFAAAGDFGIRLALAKNYIYVQDTLASYAALPYGQSINDGTLHTIQLRADSSASTAEVFLDDVSLGTVAIYKATASTYFLEVAARNDTVMRAADRIGAVLTGFYLRDTITSQTEAATIAAVASHNRYHQVSKRTTYRTFAATSRYLWMESDFSGYWVPVKKLRYNKCRFSYFRNSLILVNYDNSGKSDLFEINKYIDIRLLDDAPPLQFVAEHKNRMWGAGDPEFPHRIYFSGYRDPNLWFSPRYDADGLETADEVFNAGFLTIPATADESITAIYGDFYGRLIVATNTSTYQVSGASPLPESGDLFGVSQINSNAGAFSQESVAKVGGDLWLAGVQGVTSLQTTDKFGDLLTHKASADVQDIFTDSGPEAKKLNVVHSDKVNLAYSQSTGMLYLSYPAQGESFSNRIMQYNTYNGKWYGPWTLSTTMLTLGVVAYPVASAIVFATTAGQVSHFSVFEDDTASCSFRSQVLTGRSIAPEVAMMEKTWKAVRLYCNPTGAWPVTIKWKAEGTPWQSATVPLAKKDAPVIGKTYTVGRNSIGSEDEVYVVEYSIDTVGRSLKVECETDAAFVSVLAMEVDLTISGYDKE